ncbi:MAG: hypothetical protein U5O39_20760 [Gammaproteobacteria bacterium]|nr:hypothetical protein [Gammaproteobacteria bacterium]
MPPGCADVEPLIRRMLAKDPDERPGSAGEVAEELNRIVESAGGATVPRGSTRVQPVESGVAATVVQTVQRTVVDQDTAPLPPQSEGDDAKSAGPANHWGRDSCP